MNHSSKLWNVLMVCASTGIVSLAACKDDAPQGQTRTNPVPTQPPPTNPQVPPTSGQQVPAENRKPNIGTVTSNNQPVTFTPGSTPNIKFHAQDPDSGDRIASIKFRMVPADIMQPATGQPNTAGTEQTISPVLPAQINYPSAFGYVEACDTRNACAESQFPILFASASSNTNTGPSTMQTFCQAMIPVVGQLTQQGSTTQPTSGQTTTQPNLSQALMTLGCTLVR